MDQARTNEDRYLIGEKIQRAKSDLAAYEKIRSTLANGISLEDYQHGKKGDPISLLTLQDDGRRVKAAVAQGDVDHAKHIATLVPSIGTTVEGGLDTNFRETGNLRQAAAAQGNMPLKDVATVAWLGYDAPGEPKFGNLGDIASPNLAKAGSDRLASFLTGMQASREHGAGDAHMSLVGHSYGSTTSGMAAIKVHDGVIDDLVLCGSPGMGTYNASDLHVAEGHRWVSGVPIGDSVQGMGSILPGRSIGRGHLGTDPMDEKTFTHLSNDATGYAKYNHDAPTSNSHLWVAMNSITLSLEQRQSIQAFQRDEEPKILEFRRRLAEAGGGGAWEARIFGSEINKETDHSSGDEQPAWELVGQVVAGPYVPVPEVEKIGRELLSETYPEYELGSDEGGVRQLSWSDPVNGGFLYVTVHEGKATLMRYQTGLRPSDGTTANPRDFIPGRVDIDIPEK